VGKNSSKTQSSNPAYVDKAGEDLWNWAKAAVFGSPSAQTSSPAAAATSTTSTGGLPSGYTFGARGSIIDPSGRMLNSSESSKLTSSSSALNGTKNYGTSLDDMLPYQSYTGERVASEGRNLGKAASLAFGGDNGYGAIDSGIGFAKDAAGNFGKTYDPTQITTGTWNQEAADQYMNPFIKAALQSTSDEMARIAQQDRLRQNSGLVSKGAFGGSRHAIEDSELTRNLLDRTGSMFRSGMTDAYNTALQAFGTDQNRNLDVSKTNEANKFKGYESERDQFNQDKNRLVQIAQTLQNLGTAKSNIKSQDVERLMRTEAARRDIRQKRADVAYEDFTNQRDYQKNQLEWLAGILGGNPSRGSITTVQKPNALSQIAGLGIAGAGLMTGNPAMAMAGAQWAIPNGETVYNSASR
jgi:hypothetical protein